MIKTIKLYVSVITCLLLTTSLQAQPKLNMSTEKFDFGYTPQNSSISHDFWMHSVGLDTLQITNVKTSCGCTKAPLEKNVLAPGDSTHLEIIFSTQRYKNQVSKTTYVTTNEGMPNRTVTISSNIIIQPDSTYPVVIKPYKLNISQMGEKPRDEIKFTINNVSDKNVSPSLISVPENLFEIKLPKEIKAGQSAEATLKLKSESLDKEFQKSFTIEVNDEKYSRFTIPVIRNIRLAEASPTNK